MSGEILAGQRGKQKASVTAFGGSFLKWKKQMPYFGKAPLANRAQVESDDRPIRAQLETERK